MSAAWLEHHLQREPCRHATLVPVALFSQMLAPRAAFHVRAQRINSRLPLVHQQRNFVKLVRSTQQAHPTHHRSPDAFAILVFTVPTVTVAPLAQHHVQMDII